MIHPKGEVRLILVDKIAWAEGKVRVKDVLASTPVRGVLIIDEEMETG